jgi:NADPH:quinone reductase-like Zn-dependent oxidoreductase
MKACRVHHFGPPDVISFEDVARPHPGEGEVLVRVKAAGVGPWDAWIRAGKSVLPQPLPLILGSDLSGTVEAIAGGDAQASIEVSVSTINSGADVRVAPRSADRPGPSASDGGRLRSGRDRHRAKALFESEADRGQTVLVHGPLGNVGASCADGPAG